MQLYCQKCGDAFDDTKLFVHLRAHSNALTETEFDLTYISVLVDKSTVQSLLRAKIEYTIDKFSYKLRQSGVNYQYIPHTETQVDVWGIAFLLIFGKQIEIKFQYSSNLIKK